MSRDIRGLRVAPNLKVRVVMRVLGPILFLFSSQVVGALFHAQVLALSHTTSMGLHTESFVSPDYRATTERQFQFVGFESSQVFSNTASTSLWGINGSVLMSVDSSALHRVTPNELYYQFRQNNIGLDWTLGRKVMNWSSVDQDWRLGLIQPVDRQNPLKANTQGLSGGFVSGTVPVGSVPMHFRVWVSMVHIPDQGPGYILKNGEFQKSNPWFQPLPEEIRLSGSNKIRKIEYSVQEPDLEKLVVQPGLMTQVGFGSDYGLRFSLGAGRKVQNQLQFGLEGRAISDPLAYVEIAPTTAYHTVMTSDLAWQGRNLFAEVGALLENPEGSKNRDPLLTYISHRPTQVFSASLGYQLGRHQGRILGFTRQGGQILAEGPKAEDFSGLLGERTLYRQALAVDYSYDFSDMRAWLNTRWTQGLDTGTSLWDLSLRYFWNRNWSSTAGLFLIRGQPESTSSSTLVALENNDSVHLGVSYAF